MSTGGALGLRGARGGDTLAGNVPMRPAPRPDRETARDCRVDR
ncbi:hypothetical protein [Brachybacterium sacelli]